MGPLPSGICPLTLSASHRKPGSLNQADLSRWGSLPSFSLSFSMNRMGSLAEYPQCRWLLWEDVLTWFPLSPVGQELGPSPLHSGGDSEARRTAHGVQRQDRNPGPPILSWAPVA